MTERGASKGEKKLPVFRPRCDAYRDLGGAVVAYGKPDAVHFAAAIALAGGPDECGRVVHVGDSLEHDVAGAAAAGVDSIFCVEDGIHGPALARDRGPAAVAALCGEFGAPEPTYVLGRFAW